MARQLKLNERFLRVLRQWCNKLPEETYSAYPQQFGYTQADKDLMDEKGIKIPEHWFQTSEDYPVNHFRRCKRMFLRHGYAAVEEYFKRRGFLLVDKDGLEK